MLFNVRAAIPCHCRAASSLPFWVDAGTYQDTFASALEQRQGPGVQRGAGEIPKHLHIGIQHVKNQSRVPVSLFASSFAVVSLASAVAAADPILIVKPLPHNGLGQEAGASADIHGDFSLQGAHMIAGRHEDSGGAYLFENGNPNARQLLRLNGGVTVPVQSFTRNGQGTVIPGSTSNCSFTSDQVRGTYLGSKVALSAQWAALAGNLLGNDSTPPHQMANCAGQTGVVPTVFLAKRNALNASQPFSALNHSLAVPFRERVSAMDVSDTDLVLIGDGMGAHVYSYNASTNKWVFNTTLLPNENLFANNKDTVAIEGNRLVIGDPDDDDVYVFQKSGNTWSQLIHYHSTTSNEFGRAVDINYQYLVVAGAAGVDFMRINGSSLQLLNRDSNLTPSEVAVAFPYAAAYGAPMQNEGKLYKYEVGAQSFLQLGTFGDFDGQVTWNANNLNMSGHRVVAGFRGHNTPQNILVGTLIFDDNHELYGFNSITDGAEQARIWRNEGAYNWQRHSGSTPTSGTGPTGGAGGSTNYYYVETSQGGAYQQGSEAILVTEDLDPTRRRLDFDFHMLGSDIGQLYVEIQAFGTWYPLGVSVDGQQSSNLNTSWQHRTVDLGGFAGVGAVRLRFRYVADGGFLGDVALDNIKLTRY